MNRIIAVAVVLSSILLGQSAFAMRSAIIGGVRDGLAIGIMGEENTPSNIGIRFGAEACTGKNPVVLFLGGKKYLTTLSGNVPLSLGFGLVAYAGNKTEAGISVSAIFDRAFGVPPLFVEVGIDIAGSGKLQAQVGYRY